MIRVKFKPGFYELFTRYCVTDILCFSVLVLLINYEAEIEQKKNPLNSLAKYYILPRESLNIIIQNFNLLAQIMLLIICQKIWLFVLSIMLCFQGKIFNEYFLVVGRSKRWPSCSSNTGFSFS